MKNNNIFESTNYKKIKDKKISYSDNDVFSDDFNDKHQRIHLKHKIHYKEENIETDDFIDELKNNKNIFSLDNQERVDISDITEENIFSRIDDTTDDIAEDITEDTAEDITEDITEDTAEDTVDDITDDTTEDITDDTTEDTIDDTIEDTADDIINNKDDDKRNQSKIPIVIFLIIFLLGIGLMFYPTINNIINNSKHHYVISNYDTNVDNTSNKKIEDMLLKAQEYNKNLNHNSIQDVFSTDKVDHDNVYDNLLNINNDGLMGYIEIPKINIKLPIYHSTSEEALEKGVGHLKGSSLPIGGIGTHAILAAHRGLPTSKLFSDIDKLLVGDKFYISILGEKLAYQVDNIAVVKPSELDLLDISKDKDYITLVTCTPYGVNSHRLLVRGVHIEESKKEIVNELDNKELIYLSNDDKLLIGIIIGIFIIIIIIFIRMLVKRNEK